MNILTAVVKPDTITEEELIRLGTEIAIILDRWSNEKLRAAMAYVNSLLYCVSVSQGALVVNKGFEETKRWFNNGIKKLKGMVNALMASRSLRVWSMRW